MGESNQKGEHKHKMTKDVILKIALVFVCSLSLHFAMVTTYIPVILVLIGVFGVSLTAVCKEEE